MDSDPVFDDGDLDADLMIVGEAPGQQERRLGRPFCGQCGKLLDKILKEVVGLDRNQIYVSNTVHCGMLENRKPYPEEIGACRPYLIEEIEIVSPKCLLILGQTAITGLLFEDERVSKVGGNWYKYGEIVAMPSFHPAYILRSVRYLPKMEQDFRKVRKFLESGKID